MNVETLEFLRRQKERHAKALDGFGNRVVAQTRDLIDEPWPPASEPLTPPHRRTGNLRDGVSGSVNVFEVEGVVLTIVSARAGGDERVPFWLEFGTRKMAARPYMRPMMDQIRAAGLSTIAAFLSATPAPA